MPRGHPKTSGFRDHENLRFSNDLTPWRKPTIDGANNVQQPGRLPKFDSWSVVYDKRSATFNADHATLSTPNGRVKADTVVRD
jgi:hypothetical protein